MSAPGDVLDQVLEAVSQMAGCDRAVLGPDTLFFADLGLGSIDVVVLGEKLEQQFGRPLRFAEALGQWSRLGRDDASLAEIAAFVRHQLAETEA